MPGTCSTTAFMSSRVMKSGVLVLSGPTTLPPLYCISIMLGPMQEMRLSAYCLPVRPRVYDQDDGGRADDHAEHGEQETDFAGAEAVDGEADDLAEHHGGAGAREGAVERAELRGRGSRHERTPREIRHFCRAKGCRELLGCLASPDGWSGASSYNKESELVLLCGGMCERLKQAVLKTALP